MAGNADMSKVAPILEQTYNKNIETEIVNNYFI